MYTKVEKFLNNIIVKSILLTLLPIVYSVFIPIAIENKNDWKNWNVVLFICIMLIIVHILLIIKYARIDNQQNKLALDVEKAPKELRLIKKILQVSNKIVNDNSRKLYQIVKKDKNHKDHTDILDWEWMHAKGDEIVDVVYDIVTNIAEEGKDFSASIILKKREDNMDGFTMLSKKSYNVNHIPKMYRSFVSYTDASGYYYRKLIDKKPTTPQILMDSREINKSFKDCGDIKYSQYIALPISCSGNNTIGILQIIGYNKSIISKDKRKLERLCDEYFMTCASLVVLSDKSENIDQIVKNNIETTV